MPGPLSSPAGSLRPPTRVPKDDDGDLLGVGAAVGALGDDGDLVAAALERDGALNVPPLGVTVTAASPLPTVTLVALVVPVTVIVREVASEPFAGEVIASSGTARVTPVA